MQPRQRGCTWGNQMKRMMLVLLLVGCFGFAPVCEYTEAQISQQLSIPAFRFIENNFGEGEPLAWQTRGKGVILIDKKDYGKAMIFFAGKYLTKTDGNNFIVCLLECTDSRLNVLYKLEMERKIEFIYYNKEWKEIGAVLTLESGDCLYMDLTKDVLEMQYPREP